MDQKKFASEALPLAQLLGWAATGELQLPDFQRDWVWDDDHIRSLLASISLSYPIGAIMTLETGNPDVRFAPRSIKGAPARVKEPSFLLLDGQQRLTSLFLALRSQDPVPTRDQHGRKIGRHYYANIAKCIDSRHDREEEAIVSVPADRIVRSDFGRQVDMDLTSQDEAITRGMFPLDIVLDSSATMKWMMAYLQPGPDFDRRFKDWGKFNEQIISAFQHYEIPIIRLVKSTQKEAVCQVFEKVNTGGVTLTVFELLTATYAVDNYPLRDDWRARKESLQQTRALRRLDETNFLQIVSLLATLSRREAHLKDDPEGDRAPAVSCKRRAILRLPKKDYERWADTASAGLDSAATFLRELRIFHDRDVPYSTQIVPLAAILGLLGKDAEVLAARQRLRQWFWCGVFGEMYSGTTETRFANDVQDCLAWIRDDADVPRTVRDAQFQADRLLTMSTRNSAAYKGLHALHMTRGSRDLLSGVAVDLAKFTDSAIDIHHVFPKKWCDRQEDERIRTVAESAVNKAAISAFANKVIGGNAPSVYVRQLEAKGGMDAADLDGLLRSHEIDPAALRRDDFETFFNHRFERLLTCIEEAMGKPVNRNEDRNESPFFDPKGMKRVEEIRRLIREGESQTVEFKSTGRRNLRTGEKDVAMEWAVMKTICAFMNGHGGILLVGVGDDGEIVGIDQDYPFVKPGNPDGWEQWLTDLILKSSGGVAATDIDVTFVGVDGETVARVGVRRGAEPVYATPMKGDRKPVFFVRMGVTTQGLSVEEVVPYIRRRWPK